MVFNFLERRRQERIISIPQISLDPNNMKSEQIQRVRTSIIDGIMPWIKAEGDKESMSQFDKWVAIYGNKEKKAE